MSFCPPNPRYRLYTSLGLYIRLFWELFFESSNDSKHQVELESKLAENLGEPCAMTPQCRVGIYLALKHCLGSRKKIILSPYTIADVINMVINAGWEPVFVDIEQKSCNLDLKLIEENIDEHTGAILVTHLHGIAAQIKEIATIAKKHDLLLLEDAAQAFGARVDGKYLGTFGDVGFYSFGMYKNITCFYGGAVSAKDKDLIERIRSELSTYPIVEKKLLFKRGFQGFVTDLATHPIVFKLLTYWVFRFGHLYNIAWINKKVQTELDLEAYAKIRPHYLRRVRPLQAKLVKSQLNTIERNSHRRIEYSKIYSETLRSNADLVRPDFSEAGDHIYTYFPIQHKERDKLLRYAMANCRDIGAQHLKNCADLPAFSNFKKECPVARKAANEVILLPTYPRYTRREIERTANVVRDFLAST